MQYIADNALLLCPPLLRSFALLVRANNNYFLQVEASQQEGKTEGAPSCRDARMEIKGILLIVVQYHKWNLIYLDDAPQILPMFSLCTIPGDHSYMPLFEPEYESISLGIPNPAIPVSLTEPEQFSQDAQTILIAFANGGRRTATACGPSICQTPAHALTCILSSAHYHRSILDGMRNPHPHLTTFMNAASNRMRKGQDNGYPGNLTACLESTTCSMSADDAQACIDFEGCSSSAKSAFKASSTARGQGTTGAGDVTAPPQASQPHNAGWTSMIASHGGGWTLGVAFVGLLIEDDREVDYVNYNV
ncbi:hypothetical protein C8J57DRAFT_1249029 [Mycena rebaudengoi]|nr:hypothetical protein C8J57DRAFT_1249029 [Mycena rebaudengoi]